MADRKKTLSHEDRIVWEKVIRTVSPLHEPATRRQAPVESMQDLFGPAAPVSAASPHDKPVKPPIAPAPPKAVEPRLHPIERPTLRKIRKGRIGIDARIDLHGLKRAEAHDLLHSFLVRAHEKGMRHVLVITGKGRSGGSEGVLKREVPQWLGKAEFRLLVSGIDAAAHEHGGAGAIYVRLRRPRENRS